jgi:hypothetical protein
VPNGATPPVDDGSHHFWHHHNPFAAIRCATIEARMLHRGIHPLQKR